MMALFDIPTIYLLTGFSSLVSSVILLWLRVDHRGSGPALTLFAGAVFALGVSFICFGLRDQLGALSPPLGNAGFGFSAVLCWLGSSYLFGSRPRTAVAVSALCLFLVAVVALTSPDSSTALIRIVLSSSFTAVFLGLTALRAHRSPWRDTLKSVRLLRNLMAGYGLVIAARMLAFVLQDIPLHDDGTAAPTALRVVFAMAFGTIPFALTVIIMSIANSQLSNELRRLATTDELTGLVARRSLNESAKRMLEQAPEGGCLALLMIDLDNFKAVNDQHGHTLGDEVLRHVALVSRQVLREESLIVRYGGDEFCALVPVSGRDAAYIVAERLREAVERAPYCSGGQEIPVTLSIGVSLHRSGATLRQMFDEADKRAYRAKEAGRNRVVAGDESPVLAA